MRTNPRATFDKLANLARGGQNFPHLLLLGWYTIGGTAEMLYFFYSMLGPPPSDLHQARGHLHDGATPEVEQNLFYGF
jgi:hypothetical protein